MNLKILRICPQVLTDRDLHGDPIVMCMGK
jgi:hypothetical protein